MSAAVSVFVNPDDQIVVRIGEDTRTGDTWYLGLQRGQDMSDDRDVRALVRRLIRTWIDVLSTMQNGEITWLPFDFSDEFTRWIACSCDNRRIALRFGWSPVEGWAVDPYDASGFARAGQDFHLDVAAANDTSLYRPYLLSRLRSCMCRL